MIQQLLCLGGCDITIRVVFFYHESSMEFNGTFSVLWNYMELRVPWIRIVHSIENEAVKNNLCIYDIYIYAKPTRLV